MGAAPDPRLLGSRAEIERTVTTADTASACGSGDVAVLATPRLLAWLEAATVAALAGLGDGATSVGARVELDHRAASGVGALLRCTAQVVAVEGRVVRLAVEAVQLSGPGSATGTVVASGVVVRAVVDREVFLARAGTAQPG